MQSILSHSILLKDVIYDLASQLSTTVVQNCKEYTLTIPPAFGKGTIKGIDFSDGLGIIFYDCTFDEDMEVQFIVNQVHPLKFIFCEEGSLLHRFENEADFHSLEILENIIVASCAHKGHILQFKGGQKTIVNSLEINREQFVASMDCELYSLESGLQTVIRDVNSTNTFYHHGSYCVRMADLFIEIDDFTQVDFLRYIFLQGSAFRILTLQVLQYLDDINHPRLQSILRIFEIKLVQEASAIINNEILDFKSVQKLANQVGLNSNKLQYGFKNLYDTTVNGYVLDRRMDVANGLLKSSDFTISEIVYLVGLSSKSYFSKIFKDKYGLSPSAMRSNGKIEIYKN